jgi:hypothetical protein
METSFDNKCEILSELWLNYRDDKNFKDFVKYNDISLPLSFMIVESIIDKPGEMAESYIDESFNLLLKAVGTEDLGFETLDGMLGNIEGDDS